jgi:hypothetical protein
MSRQEAETEAVRRFGPVTPIVRATVRSLVAHFSETLRAALFLARCGLVAVGISGSSPAKPSRTAPAASASR